MDQNLKRIFIKGGVITPNELQKIIKLTKALNLNHIHFGSRQDILIKVEEEQKQLLKTTFPEFNLDIVHDHEHHNIVTSYVASDIFQQTPWLSSSTYLYLHEAFKYNPTLKINIVDPLQRLVPLFNGHINFIASTKEDYWYINLNLPSWEKDLYYPVLVYTWNIPKIAAIIEKEYDNLHSIDELFAKVTEETDSNNLIIQEPLSIKFKPFPYYEGMNKMGLNEYWLGLYWRNNKYDTHFLEDFCEFCSEHQITRICITPWKSFIVKGISANSKFALEKFLGQRGINVRHSSLELNWHLPVQDADALKLKGFIVKSFDLNDISTYGLTIGYHERNANPKYFTSMVIEKNPQPTSLHEFENITTYNVLYCRNFDPNTKDYIPYVTNIEQQDLPNVLMKLSQMYFEELNSATITKSTKKSSPTLNTSHTEIYQCKNCLTVYDEKLGDPIQNIVANTKFEALPENYECDVCGSSKNDFTKIF